MGNLKAVTPDAIQAEIERVGNEVRMRLGVAVAAALDDLDAAMAQVEDIELQAARSGTERVELQDVEIRVGAYDHVGPWGEQNMERRQWMMIQQSQSRTPRQVPPGRYRAVFLLLPVGEPVKP